MSSAKMTTETAADYLGLSVSWLNKSRRKGNGPTYLKLGGAVRYLVADLDAWINGSKRTAIYDFANDNSPTA